MALDAGSVTQTTTIPPPPLPRELATTGLQTPIEAVAVQARAGSPLEQGTALRTLDGLTGNRGTSDALARGELEPNAPQGVVSPSIQFAQAVQPAQGQPTQGQAAPSCTVEVRYTPVVGGLANHAFVTTTDADSTNYFRGGPSGGGPGGSSSGQLGSATGGSVSGSSNSNSSDSSGSSNPSNSSPSANGSSPGASRGGPGANNGPWGPIVTDYGRYVPGTVDYTTDPSGQQTVAVTPGNCDAIEGQLTRHADDIEAAQIPYNPLGANSNATARELIERSGLPQVDPVVRVPGWGTQLPGPPN